MNNDGVLSFYEQGVIKYLNEVYEGSSTNDLLNGKVHIKVNGDREISERLNHKRHGPVIVYKFDGKVKKEYYSNGEKIFLQ